MSRWRWVVVLAAFLSCGDPYGEKGRSGGSGTTSGGSSSGDEGSSGGEKQLLCTDDRDNDESISVQCGGDDCDDEDVRVHPGVDFSTEAPVAPRHGDWDCDGKVEKKYKVGSCSAEKRGNQCSEIGFFKDDVPCGGQGEYVRCKRVSQAVQDCEDDEVVVLTQACR